MKLTFFSSAEAPSLGPWECGPLCKLSNFSGKVFLNHTCSQDQAAMTVYTAPPCGDDDAVGPHNENLALVLL